MKLNLPKDWFIRAAKLEGDCEVGAGSPPTAIQSATPMISVFTHLTFGRLVLLLRRKLGLSIEQLAARAEAATEELQAIEDDPYHEPEPSTVYGLAQVFGLSVTKMMQAAGLAVAKKLPLNKEAVRFATDAKPTGPLSPEEQHALEAYIATLLDDERGKE
ncbi:MAG TPA: XRE family transcriptional regulator [Verrucomicrobiota bacterium]|jgi:transcriptional regulator with XRE-family HTH domain|nr:XRE family transcriptional regulator [Verrucomicrobiota bacterium]